MKVLIVDSTTEGQAQCAERIAEVRDVHLGGCQIDIRLADTKNYRSKISDCDLLILGPELGESAAAVATHVRSSIPHVQILMFVSEAAYAANSFQLAISAGIKRVLSENSSQLDVLQELVAIQSALCKSGRLKSAKIIVVKSVKGGAGATSVAAALAEISSDHGTNVLLWDLDTETRDLSRALSGDLALGQAFEKWLEAPHSIDREQLKRALCPIAENAHLLPPPPLPIREYDFHSIQRELKSLSGYSKLREILMTSSSLTPESSRDQRSQRWQDKQTESSLSWATALLEPQLSMPIFSSIQP